MKSLIRGAQLLWNFRLMKYEVGLTVESYTHWRVRLSYQIICATFWLFLHGALLILVGATWPALVLPMSGLFVQAFYVLWRERKIDEIQQEVREMTLKYLKDMEGQRESE